MIQDRTKEQIETQKLIIKELIQRPQIPIKILAGVIGIEESECEILVNDLEYRGSIEGRISEDYLKEQENIYIAMILEAIKEKLKTSVKTLSLSDLETYLENALVRKGKLDGDIELDTFAPGNTTYIDKLLNYNQSTDGLQKNIQSGGNDKNNTGSKDKIIKTISK